jgi:hypothetical protein
MLVTDYFAIGVQMAEGTRSAVSGVRADRTLRLDRRFLLFSLLAALLFSWPLLVFGRPSYIQDSVAYYKGGRAAVSFALAKVSGPEVTATSAQSRQESGSPAPPPEQTAREASGVRSVTYSVAAYLLAVPPGTLVLLAIAQALAAGVITVATLGAFGGLPARRTTAALIVLAAATTVAPVSFLVIPDIFAGLLIAAMVLLTAVPSRLSRGVRLLCVGIAAFAVTAHASNIPLALGLTILGVGWLAIRRYYNSPVSHWAWAWVVAPLLVGGLTTLAVNRIGFGETSLAAKRYPFVLARSINNGPGRWYLEKNCPRLNYTICTLYPNGLPKGGALEFLWGPDGVVNRATPAQMDRIRAEEADVVLAAAREHPGYEMRRLALNFARQLRAFRPFPFMGHLVVDETGTPHVIRAPETNHGILRAIWILTAISTVIGLTWLGWSFLKERTFRPVIALLFLGILGNAATCVLFAAVAPRYQARVVWLIPMFALAVRDAPERRRSVSFRGTGDAPAVGPGMSDLGPAVR